MRNGFSVTRYLASVVVAIVLIAVIGLNDTLRGGSAADAGAADTSGVYDILMNSGEHASFGVFHCVSLLGHNTLTDTVAVSQQCITDVPDWGINIDPLPPTWEDTCEELADRDTPECVPGDLSPPVETGPDVLPGPPPPPPYSRREPDIGSGQFYPGGVGAPASAECGSVDCTVFTSCTQDVELLRNNAAVGGPGPNVIWTFVLYDPTNPVIKQLDTDGDTAPDVTVDRVTEGSVTNWYFQGNDDCDAGTPKGNPRFADLPVWAIQAYDTGQSNPNPNPVPWRPSGVPKVFDLDGDGCIDLFELITIPFPITENCGDDPYNPTDSFDPSAVDFDLTGAYDVHIQIIRADCSIVCDTPGDGPGLYFNCRSYLDHNTTTDAVTMPIYCYLNGFIEINPEGYPGVIGNGYAGAPPPGPEFSPGNFVFGDIDTSHNGLTGQFNPATGEIELSGCLEDQDGQSAAGDIWIVASPSAHQKAGEIQAYSSAGDGDHTDGEFCELTTGGSPLPVGKITLTQQPGGEDRDSDQDGVSDKRELGDDAACGRRDPFNKNDYYDVSIPRDGVIDQPNDILGVILHFAPGGYPAGDENWDRPPVMVGAGAGSTWNRGSPDTVIDQPNDVLGVILQFNPGGCPPLS